MFFLCVNASDCARPSGKDSHAHLCISRGYPSNWSRKHPVNICVRNKEWIYKWTSEWIRRTGLRTSLVAQWLRIHLPMQGTRVRALVQEDLTCRRATRPVRHNYWACALKPVSHNYWACALEPTSHNYWACALEPTSHNYWSPRA